MTQKYYRLIDLLSSVISGEWGLEPLEEGSVNIIRTTNFLNNGKINFVNTVKRFVDPGTVSKKKLQSGDVIIEKSGGSPNQPVGRVVYFEKPDDGNYLCNNFTTILRADARISSKYLFYKLFHNHLIKRTLSYQNKTTGIINLQLARYLENEKIILPSLEEQQHTVKIFDLVQSLIEKRKQAIAHLDEYIKAVFLEMFGDPVSNPKGFPLTRLIDLGTWQSGGTPSRKNPDFFSGDIPWYSSGELNEIFISQSVEKISQDAIGKSAAKIIPIGSLLLGMYDSAALKSSITTIKSSCNQAIAFSKLDENKANTIYVYHCIQLGKNHYKKINAVFVRRI